MSKVYRFTIMKKLIFIFLLSCSAHTQSIQSSKITANCLITDRIEKVSKSEEEEILDVHDEVKYLEEYLSLPNDPVVISNLKKSYQEALFKFLVLKTKHHNTIKVLSSYRTKCEEEKKK